MSFSLQMTVHECSRCGSYLRYAGDPHECGSRDESHIRYNLAKTPEEKAALSEAIRQIYGIDPAFWYAGRRRPRCEGDAVAGSVRDGAQVPAADRVS